MKTCKTCRYWTKPEEIRYWEAELCAPVDPDTYEKMERGFECRLCKHPKQTFCESPTEANGFGLADGSNYKACLITGEDFGCVRHEEGEAG